MNNQKYITKDNLDLKGCNNVYMSENDKKKHRFEA